MIIPGGTLPQLDQRWAIDVTAHAPVHAGLDYRTITDPLR